MPGRIGSLLGLLFLLLPGVGAAEETIWLRGRGDDVWIERHGEARESRDEERKGLTRVATSPLPGVRAESEASDAQARGVAILVLGGDGWGTPPYGGHAYAPQFYYAPYAYTLHPHAHSHGVYPDSRRGDRRHRGAPTFHGGSHPHGSAFRGSSFRAGFPPHGSFPRDRSFLPHGARATRATPVSGPFRDGYVIRDGVIRRAR